MVASAESTRDGLDTKHLNYHRSNLLYHRYSLVINFSRLQAVYNEAMLARPFPKLVIKQARSEERKKIVGRES